MFLNPITGADKTRSVSGCPTTRDAELPECGVLNSTNYEHEDHNMAEGTLWIVGLGPGGFDTMTREASNILRSAETVVGYHVYVEQVKREYPDKEYLSTGMTREIERCVLALRTAASGKMTAMVCSGDPGIYGMAAPVFELAPQYPEVRIKLVSGVTAASSGAALLGAPISNDFAVVSLSDRLTDWKTIEGRLRAAAAGDFSIVLYNPGGRQRKDHLKRACDILLNYIEPERICGITRNIGRSGESCELTTLGRLRETEVDMFTTVFVGMSSTRNIDGRMVTPRGYQINDGLCQRTGKS
jgi:precorrin-3B C17-methyltransferase